VYLLLLSLPVVFYRAAPADDPASTEIELPGGPCAGQAAAWPLDRGGL
jgi:hypothetical protein